MGSGTFCLNSYESAPLTRSARSSKSAREVFRSTTVDSRFDPQKITVRESCISEEHPSPTAIILGMDDTGSMGFVSQALVAQGLGKLITGLHEGGVTDPHIMLQFVGDVRYDEAPLQATQFESDLRILEQLSCLWLESRGGGNNFESYNLPWYFALNKTKLESFEKLGKKGYIFTVGDEDVPDDLTTSDITRAFGDTPQRGISNKELLEAVSKQYDVFHIIALEGSYPRGHESELRRHWGDLLGRRALFMSDHTQFSNIVLAAIRINSGEEPEDVINSFQEDHVRDVLRVAFPV